mgnify:CR=1 FL=1
MIKTITADEIRDRFDGSRVITFETSVDIYFVNGLCLQGVRRIRVESIHHPECEPALVVMFDAFNEHVLWHEIGRLRTDEVVGIKESFIYSASYHFYTMDALNTFGYDINTLPLLSESTLCLNEWD